MKEEWQAGSNKAVGLLLQRARTYPETESVSKEQAIVYAVLNSSRYDHFNECVMCCYSNTYVFFPYL